MMRRLRLAALLLAGTGFVAGCAGAVEEISAPSSATAAKPVVVSPDDWPWWRGPQRNGVAEGAPPPVAWSEQQNVVWKAKVPGRGHASPTLIGDRIYLATADEEAGTQSVAAFDRSTGRQLWTRVVHTGGLATKHHHAKSTHANSTIAGDGERLFICFLNDEQIHANALNPEGEILWQTPLGPFELDYGFSASPLVHGGLVIFAADNKAGGFLAAVNRESGEIVWRKARESKTSYSSPVIVNVKGSDQLVLCGLGKIAAYDPQTGEELWSCPGSTAATSGTAVWEGDLIFASGGFPGKETVCVRASTAEQVWTNSVGAYEQSLLALNGCLYCFDDKGILYCWDAGTGKEHWKERLGGNVSSSLTAHGDVIFATNEQGTTWAFRATPDGFEELARNQLGEEGFATPSICGGRIYIRTAEGNGGDRQEWLYCIGDAERPHPATAAE